MKLSLSPEQKSLHQRAVGLCRRHREVEWQIIEILQRIEESKLYLKLEVTSLFQYAVRFLDLSEAAAYTLINLARKCRTVPKLEEALRGQSLSVSKAARIVSAVNPENSAELIAFAKTNSTRAIDFEVARRNPNLAVRASVKPISEEFVELKFAVSKCTLWNFERARAVLAQKKGRNFKMYEAFDFVMEEFLKRNDPVLKAEKAMKAKRSVKKQQLCKTELDPFAQAAQVARPQVQKSISRASLKAILKHQVFARDGGRCTYVDSHRHRCGNDQWLHIHHIRPVSQGGGDELENLTTLCSTHHDLTHQLSLPVEGQTTWLREAVRIYG